MGWCEKIDLSFVRIVRIGPSKLYSFMSPTFFISGSLVLLPTNQAQILFVPFLYYFGCKVTNCIPNTQQKEVVFLRFH